MLRWIRRHAFLIALCVAVFAIVGSCIVNARALVELPRTHVRIIATEQQVARLANLRSALAVANASLRSLSLGGDAEDAKTFTESVLRSAQLLDVIRASDTQNQHREISIACQQHVQKLGAVAIEPDSVDAAATTKLRQDTQQLFSRIDAYIFRQHDAMAELRRSADRERREALGSLYVGHALMLSVLGLLYWARKVERHRRETADVKMLEADERFALIVRGSADGLVLTDEAGCIQMVNPAFCEMLHTDADQINGQPLGSVFATTVVDEWLSDRSKVTGGDRPASRTVIATRNDGCQFLAELTIMPRTIRHQEFLAVSVRDVSEREDSRVRLKQHEALLRETPEPLQILDASGRIVYWNLGAQRLFGFEASEAIGHTSNDLLQIVVPVGDEANIHSREYSESERWIGELHASTKAGKPLRIERRRTRIQAADEIIGEVVFDLDLGERKRIQQVERRRQRLESLGTLASGIAHDLNNLLTPILMSTRMLQRENAKIDRDALLETIAKGASRGADLIAQLLTFARGGDGQHVPFKVDDLIPEVIGILTHTLPKEITIETEVEADLPEVCGDATEISQVLMNLAINSRDAMIGDGTLRIEAKRITLDTERSFSYTTLQPGQYVSITVSDTGTGIAPVIRNRIFDPFFTTKERGQGTGLGLSTSIGIIQGHHGAIDVRSVVGQGAVITVILPVHVSHTHALESNSPAMDPSTVESKHE